MLNAAEAIPGTPSWSHPVPQDRYEMAVDHAILKVRERPGERLNEVRDVLEEAERWLKQHPESL